jgi:hypothetical protein
MIASLYDYVEEVMRKIIGGKYFNRNRRKERIIYESRNIQNRQKGNKIYLG